MTFFDIIVKMRNPGPELPRQFVDSNLDPAYARAADITTVSNATTQRDINSIMSGEILEILASATIPAPITIGEDVLEECAR